MSPIVHLMCKALPQRCQIRICAKLLVIIVAKNTLVHEFMRSALLCSLLGMYKHSKKRLSWDTRKQLIRPFYLRKTKPYADARMAVYHVSTFVILHH